MKFRKTTPSCVARAWALYFLLVIAPGLLGFAACTAPAHPLILVSSDNTQLLATSTDTIYFSMGVWRPLVTASGPTASRLLWRYVSLVICGDQLVSSYSSPSSSFVSCNVTSTVSLGGVAGISMMVEAGLINGSSATGGDEGGSNASVSAYVAFAPMVVNQPGSAAAGPAMALRTAQAVAHAPLNLSFASILDDAEDLSPASTFPAAALVATSPIPIVANSSYLSWSIPMTAATVGDFGGRSCVSLSKLVLKFNTSVSPLLDLNMSSSSNSLAFFNASSSVHEIAGLSLAVRVEESTSGSILVDVSSNGSVVRGEGGFVWCTYHSSISSRLEWVNASSSPSGQPAAWSNASGAVNACVVNMSARAVVGTALKSCLVLLASPVTMCQNNYTAFVSVSIDDSMRCNNNHSDKFVLNESDFSSTGGSLTLLPVAAPVIVAQNQPEWSSTVTVKTALAASLVPNVVAGLAGAGGFLLVMCVILVLCSHRVLGAVFAAIAVALGTVVIVLLGISLDQTTKEATHDVFIDVFWSWKCGESALAPLPFRSMSLAADGKCGVVGILGESRMTIGSKVFGKARCLGADGNSVLLATSMAGCEAADLPAAFSRAQCIEERTLWWVGSSVNTSSWYATVHCFNHTAAAQRGSQIIQQLNPFLDNPRLALAEFSTNSNEALATTSVLDVSVAGPPDPAVVQVVGSQGDVLSSHMRCYIGCGDVQLRTNASFHLPLPQLASSTLRDTTLRFAVLPTNVTYTSFEANGTVAVCDTDLAADTCLFATEGRSRPLAMNVTVSTQSFFPLEAVTSTSKGDGGGPPSGFWMEDDVSILVESLMSISVQQGQEQLNRSTLVVPPELLGGGGDFTITFWVYSSQELVKAGMSGIVSERSTVVVLAVLDNWRLASGDLRGLVELRELFVYGARPPSAIARGYGVYAVVLVDFAARVVRLGGSPRSPQGSSSEQKYIEMTWSAADVRELRPLFDATGWHYVSLACTHAGGRRFGDMMVDGLSTFGEVGARQCLSRGDDFPPLTDYELGTLLRPTAQGGILRSSGPPKPTVMKGFSAVFGVGPPASSVFSVQFHSVLLSPAEIVSLGMPSLMDSQTRVDITPSRGLGYFLLALDGVCFIYTVISFVVELFQMRRLRRAEKEKRRLSQFRGDLETTYGNHELLRRGGEGGGRGAAEGGEEDDDDDDDDVNFANSIIRNARQSQLGAQAGNVARAGQSMAGRSATQSTSSSSNTTSSGAVTQFRHVVPSLIYVWQMMSIYLSSWSWPTNFAEKVRPIVYWTTIDLRFSFPTIPDVVVPAVQVFLAVGIVFILIAVLSEDHDAFISRFLGRGRQSPQQRQQLEQEGGRAEGVDTSERVGAEDVPLQPRVAVPNPATSTSNNRLGVDPPPSADAQHQQPIAHPSHSPTGHAAGILPAPAVPAPTNADLGELQRTLWMQQQLAVMLQNPNATPEMRATMTAWQSSLMQQQQQRLEASLAASQTVVSIPAGEHPRSSQRILGLDNSSSSLALTTTTITPHAVVGMMPQASAAFVTAAAADEPQQQHRASHGAAVTAAISVPYSNAFPVLVRYHIRIPPSSRLHVVTDEAFKLAVERLVVTTAHDTPTALEACDILYQYEMCTVSLEGHHVGKDGVDVSLYLTKHEDHHVVKGFAVARVQNPHRCPVHHRILCMASSVHKVGNKYGRILRNCGYDSLEGTVYRKLTLHETPCKGSLEDFYLCLEKGCTYAVCADCFEGSLLQMFACGVISFIDTLRQLGFVQVAGFVLLLSAQALYIPVMQTCFMILWCHPTYQCQFPGCYKSITATYAVFVGMACTTVALMGVGFVWMLTRVVLRRKTFLCELFAELLTFEVGRKKPAVAQQVDEDGIPIPPFSSDIFSSAGSNEGDDAARGPAQREGTVMLPMRRVLQAALPLTTWGDILDRDISMMKSLYEPFVFKFMWVQPFTMVLRMAAVIPAAFATPNSLSQVGGAASCESFLLLLLTIVPLYVDPWVALMARVSSIHQVLQLGLSALDRADRAEDNLSTRYSTVMLYAFIAYALFIVACLLMSIGYPLLKQYLKGLRKSHDGRLKQYEERFQRMQRAVRPAGDPRGRRRGVVDFR